MKIHCPHCLEETELDHSVADSVIVCAACKRAFDPRKKETVPNAERAGSPELLPGICAGDGFGGYVLERRLGRGGMGVVFAATQVSLGRKVAIKVLAHELLNDPEFVRRFDREARVLASLNHPHIVQVIDKGIERGNVFLVMEYVDGVSLRDVLSEKKMPPGEAIKLIPQLCDALEYAHSRGVVHRDIKPENILVARDGTMKIADFGLARIVGEGPSGRITRSNVIMGSLDYMAPEQRERTRDADHRADIYAIGVVFYEMLTGELPLGRFEAPSKKVKLEVDIDEVIFKVLSKDPELRYQRASEVAADIRRRSGAAAPTTMAARAGDGPPITKERVRSAARTFGEWIDDFAHTWLLLRVLPFLGLMVIAIATTANSAQHYWDTTVRYPALAAIGGFTAGVIVVLAVWLRIVDRIQWRKSWSVAPNGKPHQFPVPAVVAGIFGLFALPVFDFPWDWFTAAAMVPIVAAFYSQSSRFFTEVPEAMPRSPANALPSELAHLAQPVAPVAPVAPPAPVVEARPRLSLLAFLGFLAGCALFAAGSVAAAGAAWVRASDWRALEIAMKSRDGREALAFAAVGDLTAAEAILFTVPLVAGIVCVLVAAFNGATMFSVGRRTGVRGGGYAFFGMLLAAAAGLEVVGTASILHKPIRTAAADLPQGSRADRLVAVNGAYHGGAWVTLEGILANDPSPAVRFAAARALAQHTTATQQPFRDQVRGVLEKFTGDTVAAVADVAAWGLQEPSSRRRYDDADDAPRAGPRAGLATIGVFPVTAGDMVVVCGEDDIAFVKVGADTYAYRAYTSQRGGGVQGQGRWRFRESATSRLAPRVRIGRLELQWVDGKGFTVPRGAEQTLMAVAPWKDLESADPDDLGGLTWTQLGR